MTKNVLDAWEIHPATLDYYIARGRRERARAVAEMIRGAFAWRDRRRAERRARAAGAGDEPETAADRARAA